MACQAAQNYSLDSYGAFPSYRTNPFCYACAMRFEKSWGPKFRGDGIYRASEMEYWFSWQAIYRLVLYNPTDGTTTVSGVSLFAGAFQAPLDPDEGLIRTSAAGELEDRIAKPSVIEPFRDMDKQRNLVGFPLHVTCWRLLKKSKMGRYIETDLNLILDAIRHRSRDTGVGGWAYGFLTATPGRERHDPGDSNQILGLIHKSRQEREKQITVEENKRPQEPRDCLFSRLPLEIQHKIMDDLEGRDVLELQKALDWQLDESYWRQKIRKTLYFEIPEVIDQSLDWQYLYFQLESLANTDTMIIRKHILDSLSSLQEYFFRRLR
ncbi:hypothetical protein P170DRAFT_464769 [Aspergillus steynii IBT 23096]|uniref:F-box domain-containing protein n=1 Tax=Aspergillus steynii IBT 23096 TaxID=1392250 RepID=A0A2I2G8V2_9EURO|nr:uncharacterized protein P170DRAFT_464769 [Aspergillus steynii IBT 23096]PLB49304.1 hypothetical protein P170DRAFT_464769 [Aspergillus steynii IBT 23096]